MLTAEPEYGTTNFNEKIIKINFDEFLQLKDLAGQMVISPPMKTKPDVQVRGRSVVIKVKDTLREETTYNLFLGDAIADLNEGNPFPSFRYVFSTGDHIDSCSISGNIIDAETGEPVEDVWVVLYPQCNDTMFFSTTPYYIASTDESGHFHLDQLKDTIYKCFAIEDINSNYFFDLPAERIAFLDTLINPGYTTSRPDSLPDSILFTPVSTVPNITMKLYSEPDTILKLMENNLIEDYVVEFVFNNPATDLRFNTVDSVPLPERITRTGIFGDTVRWWIKDTTISVMNIAVLNDTTVLDTLRIPLTIDDSKAKSLLFSNNLVSGSKLIPGMNFTLRSANPIGSIENLEAILMSRSDSLQVTMKISDSLDMTLSLDYPLMTDTAYLLILNDSSVYDMYGNTNDSTTFRFSVASDEEFGTLEFEVTLPEGENQYVLTLTDQKGNAITSRVMTETSIETFDYLLPGKYGFTLLLDEDGNGRWSSGRITKRLQPEEVLKYDKEVDIRANWVIQESWQL